MAEVALFLVAAGATMFCAAVNAYTLRIAYPLWRFVGEAEFERVHAEYLRRLGPVITLPHVVMFFASAGLLWRRPGWMSSASAAWLFCLDATVVVVSAFVAGPVHTRFSRQGTVDEAGMRRLMAVSWVRVGLMAGACGVLWRVVWPVFER